jgi:hypothetical protein
VIDFGQGEYLRKYDNKYLLYRAQYEQLSVFPLDINQLQNPRDTCKISGEHIWQINLLLFITLLSSFVQHNFGVEWPVFMTVLIQITNSKGGRRVVNSPSIYM